MTEYQSNVRRFFFKRRTVLVLCAVSLLILMDFVFLRPAKLAKLAKSTTMSKQSQQQLSSTRNTGQEDSPMVDIAALLLQHQQQQQQQQQQQSSPQQEESMGNDADKKVTTPAPATIAKPAPVPSQSSNVKKATSSLPRSESPIVAATTTTTTVATASPQPPAPRGPPPPPPPPSFNFTIGEPKGCELKLNLEKVKAQFSSFPKKISLNDLMEIVQAGQNPGMVRYDGNGNTDTSSQPPIAMCKLRQNGNYAHFPHMMQQFSRCFSFWQIYARYQRYLYMYNHVHAANRGADLFNKGMFEILTNIFNVTVVYDFDAVNEQTLMVKPFYDMGMGESLQQGIVFQSKDHAKVFRDQVQAYYGIEPAGCKMDKTEPIIGILNRKPASNRTILNLSRLQTNLGKLTTQPVQLRYFEGTTFLEQITFMSSVDILVSPHGAQLTSLNFIPPCGGVFEIFPRGYYLPHFFGPLAMTSGLRHGFVYTGEDVQKEWYKGNLIDRSKRFRARDQNVCVPLNTTLEIIGKMVDKWKVCCQEAVYAG